MDTLAAVMVASTDVLEQGRRRRRVSQRGRRRRRARGVARRHRRRVSRGMPGGERQRRELRGEELSKEGRKVVVKLRLGDGEVVVEKIQELLLHEVDLGLGEEVGVAALKEQKHCQSWPGKGERGEMELTQCLFLGDESLRYFAAQMLEAGDGIYPHQDLCDQKGLS